MFIAKHNNPTLIPNERVGSVYTEEWFYLDLLGGSESRWS